MTTQAKVLRDLNADQQIPVDRLFKMLATVAGLREGDPVILARNKFVDSTIADLLDEVNGGEFLLVVAFSLWLKDRELDGILWPVTQFQSAIVGAVAAAEYEICAAAKYKSYPVSYEYKAAQRAFQKYGGVR